MKSYLSKFGVLLFGAMFAVAACQDYDEDIRQVNDKLDETASKLTEDLDKAIADLEAKHAADLSEVEAALEGEIAKAVEEATASLEEAYKAADEALKKSDAALQTQINEAVNQAGAAIEQLYGALDAAKAELKKGYEDGDKQVLAYVEGQLNSLNEKIAALEKADKDNADAIAKVAADLLIVRNDLDKAIESFTAQIQNLQKQIDANKAAIADLAKDLADAKAELEAAIAAEKEARLAGDAKLDEAIKAETKAREDALKLLAAAHEQDIKDVKALIESVKTALETAIANEEAARKDADEKLQDAIDAEEKARKEGDDTIVAKLNELKNALNEYIAKTDTEIKNLKEADAKLQEQINKVAAALDEFKKFAEETYATKDELNALHTHVTEIKHDVANEFQGVLLTIEELNKALAGLQVDVDALLERVQSIVFVPEYTDLKATVNYAKLPNPLAEGETVQTYKYIPRMSSLRYKVNASDAAAEATAIANAWAANNNILSYTLESVVTRAAVEANEALEIKNVTAKGEYLVVDVLATLPDSFYLNASHYAASLRLVAGVDDIASEYTTLTPAKNYVEIGIAFETEGSENESHYLSVSDDSTTVEILKGVAPILVKKVEGKYVALTEEEIAEFDLAIEFKENITYTQGNAKKAVAAENFVFTVVDGKTVALKLASVLSAEYVHNTVTVEHTYTVGELSIKAVSTITLTPQVIKAVFAPVEIDWSLKFAMDHSSATSTPYDKKIVTDTVKYTLPDGKEFPLNVQTVLATDKYMDYGQKRVSTLNGKPIGFAPVTINNYKYPGNTATVYLNPGYEFPKFGAEPNKYVVTWYKINVEETLVVEVEATYILNPLPQNVEVVVEEPIKMELLKGGNGTFKADYDFVAKAYDKFENYLGFEKEGNFQKFFNTLGVDNSAKEIKLNVVDNKDESYVVFNATKNPQATYDYNRTVQTWFGVDFLFKATVEPVIPNNNLIPSTDFMSPDSVVTVEGRINPFTDIYEINLADLGKYVDVTNIIENNLKVEFEVVDVDPTDNIDDKAGIALSANTVDVILLDKPIKNVYGELETQTAILNWNQHPDTEIVMSAKLLAEDVIVLDEMEFKLVTADPIVVNFGEVVIPVDRYTGAAASADILQNIVVTSIVEDVDNLLDYKAALGEEFKATGADHRYGLDIKVTIDGVYEEDPAVVSPVDLTPYSPNKWAIDTIDNVGNKNGVDDPRSIILLPDDGILRYPIYAQFSVAITHNIHGSCTTNATIIVKFVQK